MSSTPDQPRAPYRIETDRLVLRPYEPADAETLRATTARSKAHLLEFMPWARLEPQTLDQKLDLILHFRARFDSRTDFVMGIFEARTGRLVGGTGLHARGGPGSIETGYWITPENEGRGLVTEAVQALVHVAIDGMGIDMVVIRIAPDNTRSLRIPEKLGFQREGLLRRAFREPNSEPRDVVQFTLLDTEFHEQPWRAPTRASVSAFDALGQPFPLA